MNLIEKIEKLSLSDNKFKAREDCEIGYEIAKEEVIALIEEHQEEANKEKILEELEFIKSDAPGEVQYAIDLINEH